jgi:hypothetical protein
MATELSKIDKPTKATINSLFKLIANVAVPLEQLNVILSTPPPAAWVKTHPNITTHKYLPIDKVEYLLRSCFKKFQIEVKEVKQLFNAIQVTVRVHYFNPATNEMMFHDGVGAWDLQTSAGSGPLKLDISNINRGAVPMATGIAKSVAIKDACDHFGTLFGANLNRKDVQNFEGNQELLSYDAINDLKEKKRVINYMSSCDTIGMLETVKETANTLGLRKEYEAKEAQING